MTDHPFIEPASIGIYGDLVGFQVEADFLCIKCTCAAWGVTPGHNQQRDLLNVGIERGIIKLSPGARPENWTLRGCAGLYDSRDFPKPVGRNEAQPGDACGNCHKRLR
jgi:hypothetical protein